MASSEIIDVISDISKYRQPIAANTTPTWPYSFVELWGGKLVDMLFYEPDPSTYRHVYYYNTKSNRLFRRVITLNQPSLGIIRAHWRAVSQ